jgi:hypothetical protein
MPGTRRWSGRFGLVTLVALLAAATFVYPSRPAAAASCTLCAGGEFFTVAPTRIYDSRSNGAGPMAFGQVRSLPVLNRAGVPAKGVFAVALNVTVDQPTAAGFLTVFPGGRPVPLASNLNFTPGSPVANFVVVGVGANGQVSFTAGPAIAATVHVIVDVVGWYANSSYTGGRGGRLIPLTPARVLDTRNATGGIRGPLGNNASFNLELRGVGGVPNASNVTAVILNLTGTDASRTTYVQATPAGAAAAGSTSSLNILAGQTKANLAMVPLSADGHAHFFNLFGPMDLIADVVGYYQLNSDDSRAGRVVPLGTPFRAIETRASDGGDGVKLGPGQEDTWDFGPFISSLRDPNAQPAGNVSGVIMNFTATELSFPYRVANTGDYMTVFPNDAKSVPLASNIDFGPGDNMPNLVAVPLSADHKLAVYNYNGFVHYLADVSAVILAN